MHLWDCRDYIADMWHYKCDYSCWSNIRMEANNSFCNLRVFNEVSLHDIRFLIVTIRHNSQCDNIFGFSCTCNSYLVKWCILLVFSAWFLMKKYHMIAIYHTKFSIKCQNWLSHYWWEGIQLYKNIKSLSRTSDRSIVYLPFYAFSTLE